MTIDEMVDVSYNQAKELGWTEKEVPIPEMIALIHSEVSEALEAFRDNQPIYWINDKGKPEGIASEFADILIRIGHYSKILKIDLEQAVIEKLKYNLTRGYRHGGKAI